MDQRVGGEAVEDTGQRVPAALQPFCPFAGNPAEAHPGGATDGAVLGAAAEVVAFAGDGVDRHVGQHAFGHAEGIGHAHGAFPGRVGEVGGVGLGVLILVDTPRQPDGVLGEVAPGGRVVVAAEVVVQPGFGVVVLTGVTRVVWNSDLAYSVE